MLKVTDTLAIKESEFHERFVRASGPGGQNINKVASAVELHFNVPASTLPDAVKARLITIARKKVSAEGVLQIDSRAFRTQAQNREAARERLIALVRRAATLPKRRRPTRTPAAAKERRLETKKRRGDLKRQRRTTAE